MKWEKIKTNPLDDLIEFNIELNFVEKFSKWDSSANGASFDLSLLNIAWDWYLY